MIEYSFGSIIEYPGFCDAVLTFSLSPQKKKKTA